MQGTSRRDNDTIIRVHNGITYVYNIVHNYNNNELIKNSSPGSNTQISWNTYELVTCPICGHQPTYGYCISDRHCISSDLLKYQCFSCKCILDVSDSEILSAIINSYLEKSNQKKPEKDIDNLISLARVDIYNNMDDIIASKHYQWKLAKDKFGSVQLDHLIPLYILAADYLGDEDSFAKIVNSENNLLFVESSQNKDKKCYCYDDKSMISYMENNYASEDDIDAFFRWKQGIMQYFNKSFETRFNKKIGGK